MAHLRFLYRRPVVDSGGPGKYRGGLSHEVAFTAKPDALLDDKLRITFFGKGVRSPMAHGLFGGYPGCPIGYATFRDLTPAGMLERPRAHDPRSVEHQSWGTFEISSRDLQVIRYSGGGGYGDPLERDPDAVSRDVVEGAVSDRAARDVYCYDNHNN